MNSEDGERRHGGHSDGQIMRTKIDRWWYINRFCCCSLQGGTQFISYLDSCIFIIVTVFMVFCLAVRGGGDNYRGSKNKYMIILTVLLYLILYIPATMCILLRWRKPAVSHYPMVRTVGVIIIGIWEIIVFAVQASFMDYNTIRIVIHLVLFFLLYPTCNMYIIMCLKSYLIEPEPMPPVTSVVPPQQVIYMQAGQPVMYPPGQPGGQGVYQMAPPPQPYIVQAAPGQAPYGTPIAQPLPQQIAPPAPYAYATAEPTPQSWSQPPPPVQPKDEEYKKDELN